MSGRTSHFFLPGAVFALWLLIACSGPETPAPSDDPADWDVDTSASYDIQVSEPKWIIPSTALPEGISPLAANNNVDIVSHKDRLFLAWRTAESHFASKNARLYVISSRDEGETWEYERDIALGSDLREPRFLSIGGRLILHFFEAGGNPLAFEPKYMWRVRRLGKAKWSEPEQLLNPGEIPWNVKVRGGAAYLTSYEGNHYQAGVSELDVHFRKSSDGLNWEPVNPDSLVVYRGGVSEVAFEFDPAGSLWAVTRNEDGDATGFGSHLCFAPPDNLGAWDCSSRSDPNRYDSPVMFRHGNEIYLIARRDIGGPYDQGLTNLSFDQQKSLYLTTYSARPKRTAIYRINQTERKVEFVLDLPSAGDTAFPAVRRTGAHTFLVANYTSPLDETDQSWIDGQTSARGTQIYLLALTFIPK
jgi:hypothetical protein